MRYKWIDLRDFHSIEKILTFVINSLYFIVKPISHILFSHLMYINKLCKSFSSSFFLLHLLTHSLYISKVGVQLWHSKCKRGRSQIHITEIGKLWNPRLTHSYNQTKLLSDGSTGNEDLWVLNTFFLFTSFYHKKHKITNKLNYEPNRTTFKAGLKQLENGEGNTVKNCAGRGKGIIFT